MPFSEPLEEMGVVGQGPGDLLDSLDRLCATLGHMCRRPSMDIPHVTDEVSHPPLRAGRDGSVQIGTGCSFTEELALEAKRGDVLRDLHDRSVPRVVAPRRYHEACSSHRPRAPG